MPVVVPPVVHPVTTSRTTYKPEYSVPEVLNVIGADKDKAAQDVMFGHGVTVYSTDEVSTLYQIYSSTGAPGMRDYFLAQAEREAADRAAMNTFELWFLGTIAVCILLWVGSEIWKDYKNNKYY